MVYSPFPLQGDLHSCIESNDKGVPGSNDRVLSRHLWHGVPDIAQGPERFDMQQDLTRDTSALRAPIRNVATQERHCTTRSKHVSTKVRDDMEDALKQARVKSAEERAWADNLIF